MPILPRLGSISRSSHLRPRPYGYESEDETTEAQRGTRLYGGEGNLEFIEESWLLTESSGPTSYCFYEDAPRTALLAERLRNPAEFVYLMDAVKIAYAFWSPYSHGILKRLRKALVPTLRPELHPDA